MPADIAAHPPVFFLDRLGLGQQGVARFGRRCAFLLQIDRTLNHASDGPEQVDGCRPAFGQIIGHLLQASEEGGGVLACHRLQTEAYPVCGRNTNSRRPAHPQRANGLPDSLHVAAFQFHQLQRQPSLINHPEAAVGIANPM